MRSVKMYMNCKFDLVVNWSKSYLISRGCFGQMMTGNNICDFLIFCISFGRLNRAEDHVVQQSPGLRRIFSRSSGTFIETVLVVAWFY